MQGIQVIDSLDSESNGYITGVSLSTFLQLVEMEKTTFTVKVTSGRKTGTLYMLEGELIQARAGKLRGNDAAYKIISWENPRIEMYSECNKTENQIEGTLQNVLMEAFRLKDEKVRDDEDNTQASGAGAVDTQGGRLSNSLVKEKTMALETLLNEIKAVKGYKASGILDFTGELLASDSSSSDIDVGMIGATFNDIFRSASEACKSNSMEACRDMTIQTQDGVIVMHCSGVDSASHIHLIGILAADGNQALMKMQIAQAAKNAMAQLV